MRPLAELPVRIPFPGGNGGNAQLGGGAGGGPAKNGKLLLSLRIFSCLSRCKDGAVDITAGELARALIAGEGGWLACEI